MTDVASLEVEDTDLPALFRTADKSSVIAQSRYLKLFKANLGVLVVAAVLDAIPASSSSVNAGLGIGGGVVLLGGLLLSVTILNLKPNRQWYLGRAVAESVKTIAWRYMTCAEPYLQSLGQEAADQKFSHELREILRQSNEIGPGLGGSEAAADQITAKMRAVRGLPLPLRKEIYFKCRINDQRGWYARKAKFNAENSKNWMISIVILQALGVAAAFSWMYLGDFKFSSIFVALAASALAWLQVKQHGELSSAYSLAAHELGTVSVNAQHVTTEETFTEFVSDAENAISREHTMWVARRDIV